jgi:ABC-type phosphate transport system substrate-binding protein
MMPRATIVLMMLAMVAMLSTVSPAGTSPPAALEPQGPAAADECLAILVNRSNPVENLSSAELRKVFLGEQNHWSDGHRVTVVMLESGKPERQVVLTRIYRMEEKDFNAYFLHHVFTGDIHAAPTTLATPTEVLRFVSNVQGAIGYLRTSAVDESVKVVRIDSVLPCDKEYSIRMHAKSGK